MILIVLLAISFSLFMLSFAINRLKMNFLVKEANEIVDETPLKAKKVDSLEKLKKEELSIMDRLINEEIIVCCENTEEYQKIYNLMCDYKGEKPKDLITYKEFMDKFLEEGSG